MKLSKESIELLRPAYDDSVQSFRANCNAVLAQADSWKEVFVLCCELGMELNEDTGCKSVLVFIRKLKEN